MFEMFLNFKLRLTVLFAELASVQWFSVQISERSQDVTHWRSGKLPR